MVNVTFIGHVPQISEKKFQCLDGLLGMKPSQLVDIAIKVCHAQETRKLKKAIIFLEAVWGNQR